MLWRHGRTEWNARGRFQGQLDPPLDATGRAQTQVAAAVLSTLRLAALVSSDQQRALDTAATLGVRIGLPPRPDPRLREIGLGCWQGLTREQARERFPAEYAAWAGGADVRRGGGETYAEVGVRAVAAVRAALAAVPAGSTLVCVTHGGTARAAIGTLLELAPASWWRLAPLGNARWSVLVETGRGWRLEEHNAGTVPERTQGDDTR